MTTRPETVLSLPAAASPMFSRMSSGPLLVDRNRTQEFTACLQAAATTQDFAKVMAENTAMQSDFWPAADHWMARYRPYTVVNGVLVIPVMGALVNHFGATVGRWITGYDYIEQAVARGLEDEGVNSILLHVDSPGGEVSGVFELTDFIYEARSVKPIVAVADDWAASAAYALASAADTVVVTRSGHTGSVGVLMMHMEVSEALKDMGIKVTFVFAGEHKVEGNMYEPLEEATVERWQARIDKLYGVFTSTVARNREMGQDAVRETEALTFDAEESVEIGFADRIGDFTAELSAKTETDEEESDQTDHHEDEDEDPVMTEKTTKTTADAPTITQADVDTAVREAVAADRERTNAVLSADAYKGREALAGKLLKTGMSADEIVDALAAVPVAAPAPASEPKKDEAKGGKSHFAAAMDREDHPNVGAGAQGSGDEQPDRVSALFATAGYDPAKTAH